MVEPRIRHVSAIDEVPDIMPGEKPPVDVGDPATLKATVKETKQAVATQTETIKWIMGEEKGRKFIFDFLFYHRAYDNPFRASPYETAFNCGEKNAALWMLTRVEQADPALYLKMLEENRNG